LGIPRNARLHAEIEQTQAALAEQANATDVAHTARLEAEANAAASAEARAAAEADLEAKVVERSTVEATVLHHTSVAQDALAARRDAEERASSLAKDLERTRAAYLAHVEQTHGWFRTRLLAFTVTLLVLALAAAMTGGWLMGQGNDKLPFAIGAGVLALVLAGLAALGRTGPRGRDFDQS
jgi:hypothetical protein